MKKRGKYRVDKLVKSLRMKYPNASVIPATGKGTDIIIVEYKRVVEAMDFKSESGDSAARSSVDWWPMFCHDQKHTGYSTSKAPNTNYLLWNYTTRDDAISSPAVADGKVYIGSYDDNVYCLDALTGAKIWNYTTDHDVYSSPAVANGFVYVGSRDGNIYAFADMPWDITGPAMWVPDGKCDMRDVALIAKLFGSLEGDGKYDVRADITGPTYLTADCKIDMRDVALAAKHYGEICD